MRPSPKSLKDRDIQVMEQAVLPHMMHLMSVEAFKQGYQIRRDFLHQLNVAGQSVFVGLDAFSISRIAKRTDDAATALLHDLSPDDAGPGLLTCCAFVLTLVEEGLADPRQQAVLAALSLAEDAKLSDSAIRWDEKKFMKKARGLISRANLMGLFVKVPVNQLSYSKRN